MIHGTKPRLTGCQYNHQGPFNIDTCQRDCMIQYRILVTDRVHRKKEIVVRERGRLRQFLLVLVAGHLCVLLASLRHELRQVVLFRLRNRLGL